jgi:hypothetical protein
MSFNGGLAHVYKLRNLLPSLTQRSQRNGRIFSRTGLQCEISLRWNG